MNVTAIIPTRSDVDDLMPVLESLPDEWEKIIYNGRGYVLRWPSASAAGVDRFGPVPDVAVFGRYAALEYTRPSCGLIYTQDDDVIVSDPQAIVDEWLSLSSSPLGAWKGAVCNLPEKFRRQYEGSALVGFGAVFHRDAPARAFARWHEYGTTHPQQIGSVYYRDDIFNRRCDHIFAGLTPVVLVDIAKEDRECATDSTRMYRQGNHVWERERVMELCQKIREGS